MLIGRDLSSRSGEWTAQATIYGVADQLNLGLLAPRLVRGHSAHIRILWSLAES